MELRNENKKLLECSKEQMNHTLALFIMKKYCKEGKISRKAYSDMVEKYKDKVLAFDNK